MKKPRTDGAGAVATTRRENATTKMARIMERLDVQRTESAEKMEAEGYSQDVIDTMVDEHDRLIQETIELKRKGVLRRRGGATAVRLIEQAQLQLFDRVARGDFKQHAITPGRQYPTIFTRVPIFFASQKATARKQLDKDLALPFETSWGKGRKFGPFLSIYDEDTLLALGALRQRQLTGMGNRMPVKVMNPFDPAAETQVDVLYTTVGEIEDYLGNKTGGRGYKKRLDSIKRLAAVTIEFTQISDPSIKPIIKAKTFNTKIIDMMTEELSTDSILYIQFPPAMVMWLREQYTFIDMDIRRQLRGDNAKSIHRFLSGQDTINISAEKLAKCVMFTGPLSKFMESLRGAMKQLEALGWVEYEIRGTGRKEPWVLTGRRLKKK